MIMDMVSGQGWLKWWVVSSGLVDRIGKGMYRWYLFWIGKACGYVFRGEKALFWGRISGEAASVWIEMSTFGPMVGMILSQYVDRRIG